MIFVFICFSFFISIWEKSSPYQQVNFSNRNNNNKNTNKNDSGEISDVFHRYTQIEINQQQQLEEEEEKKIREINKGSWDLRAKNNTMREFL